MKILFAVSNENIATTIKKQYQDNYKGMLTTKNVYYFNAIIKELQNDKTYDVVIISEDLEPFANNNYDAVDKFLIGKLADIREESKKVDGTNLPIIFIMTDRHVAGDNLLCRLYEIGIYNALFENNRSIHKVCELISNPRNREMAKKDYRIIGDSQPEDDGNNVKESEIKSIIDHYKKLGKNEEKYVESFDNIASQYSDTELKIIIKFLPLNVKAVLEEQSPKYQELMTFGQDYKKSTSSIKPLGKIREKEKKLEQKTDIILEQLSDIKTDSQIIVPKEININSVQKIEETNNLDNEEKLEENEESNDEFVLPGFETVNENVEKDSLEDNIEEPEVIVPVKKGRGRPKKVKPVEEVESAKPKKRGRPKKVKVEEIEEQPVIIEEQPEIIQEQYNTVNEQVEDNDDIIDLFGIADDDDEEKPLQDTAKEIQEEKIENVKNDIDNIEENKKVTVGFNNKNLYSDLNEDLSIKSGYSNYNYQNIEHLISNDKKIAAFIGTSKNGTSFVVNNMAQIFSNMNINTAILDMTKNKNAYYIYNKNDENLRKRAEVSIEKLREGIAEGIVVNKNLTVYTASPGDNDNYEEADLILKTLIQNHSLVLIDCDFNTPFGYFDNSQDIYLVQSMDILTIQPLTAFLKELKSRDILKQEKVKIIINKEVNIKDVSEKVLIGGIANYNDPSMSYMTELFDRNNVKSYKIPFDLQVYTKYLGTIADCNLSLNGYSKQFLVYLKNLANGIYPMLSSDSNKNANKKQSFNNYNSTPFSNDINDKLNHMKTGF